MASIRVIGDLDDLEKILKKDATLVKRKGRGVVKRNVHKGWNRSRSLSRTRSGPHGKFLYKRITEEMTGPLQGEFGYEGQEFVGGNFRHGRNTDMPSVADQIGEGFAKDAGDILDGLL